MIKLAPHINKYYLFPILSISAPTNGVIPAAMKYGIVVTLPLLFKYILIYPQLHYQLDINFSIKHLKTT